MSDSTQVQLRFPSMPGCTIRADFSGGAMSSDLGPLFLRGIDKQIGLTSRLANAFDDQRHPSYIEHSIQELFAQRSYQIASLYEDGNDSNE
ncbi:transposase, partial [Magnetococcales bacterium HHB-1]